MSIALASHVSATDTDSGMVLLDLRSGRYWQLNGMAAVVLRGLTDGKQPDEIARALRQRFPTQTERVDSDVAAFVDSLRQAKLVTA